MRRRRWMLLLAMAVTIMSAGLATAQALRSGQPAPDVAGGPWINSAPLTLADLRGRVALVEFWTFG
jgi:ABC-type nitrate/sulfonate/bicarbonate transport system substrate-binding protein